MPIYDRIGAGYTKHRCADPRIVDQIVNAMGLAPPAVIADIGAGTGNYSRALADLVYQIEAVEPSEAMRRQAILHDGVRWHDGTAEHIPLPDNSVDGIICVLSVHHFSSLPSAIGELARICPAGPIVWFTFDHAKAKTPWLHDYFPALWEGTCKVFPPLENICRLLETGTHRRVEVIPYCIPHDLQDCFMAAGWRRPEMYLDPQVRACMSGFALAEPETLKRGLLRLQRDFDTGLWKRKYRHLLDLDAIDWGYRLIKVI